jgi:Sortilin, neurotensin receptor 3,
MRSMRVLCVASLSLGLLLLAPAPGALAAKAKKSAAPAQRKVEPTYDESLFKALEYRLVGPFRGGRATAVAGVRGEPDTFYMGSTGGGVWKTTDAGGTWVNVSDSERGDEEATAPHPMGDGPPAAEAKGPPGDRFGSASVGAIAVAESDPNVVYAGMGSACIRGNVSAGDGVYKSTDAGKSWHHVGLTDAGQIGSVRIDPKDPDTVYVAVLGHAFGANPERGVYRSRDGGASWQRVLFVSDQAGAVDLAMDATNPRILYAAIWQVVRKPWTLESGGPGSGLYKSTDGGDTWVELTKGLPEGTKGRIGVAVSPARPGRVWALVEHKEKGGLYRSDNGGASFRLVNSDRELQQRAWYYTHVFAHPTDPETVFALNTLVWRSDDGGKTFNPVRTPHGDNHDLWIDPDDPAVMIESNDGGAVVTGNGGRSWSGQDNQPTAEMYRVTVDDQYPYWLYGGQQDNSAVAIPSRTMGGGIGREDWYIPGGCESATVAVDPRNPDVTWAGCYGGSIERHDRKLDSTEEVMEYPQVAVGQAAKDLKYRFQWNAPIRISPHDPNVLYHTSNFVHRSRDGGQSWEVVSPDLTRNDPSKQGYAGGPITWDNTGIEVYDTIFAFEESPLTPGLLWAGSDDGLVHVSRDDGASWQDVTPKEMPEWGTVNAIELSRHDPGRAYLAVHRYRLDDFAPYVFRTDDYGQSWVRLTDGGNGIPANDFVRVVREDPEAEGLLYAGTEYGLYVSFDAGATWQSLQLNLPMTPVTDLAVKRDDLVVATQGRSYWILDDLSPLHQLAAAAAAGGKPFLFRPRDTYQYGGGGFGFGGGHGENPPRGEMIFYDLGEDLSKDDAQEVKLEILDSAGEVLRSLSSQKPEPTAPNPFARFFPEAARPHTLDAGKGMNRYVWDFALRDAEVLPDVVMWGSGSGPEVPPGTYQARLTVGDQVQTQSFEVLGDPRQPVPQADLEARFDLAKKVWQALTRSQQALKTARSVRDQVKDLAARVDPEKSDKELQDNAKALTEALTGVEEELHQTKAKSSQDVLNFPPKLDNQIAGLLGAVESVRGRPTAGSSQRWDDLEAALNAQTSRLDQLLTADLAAFDQLIAARQVPAVVVGKTEWKQ